MDNQSINRVLQRVAETEAEAKQDNGQKTKNIDGYRVTCPLPPSETRKPKTSTTTKIIIICLALFFWEHVAHVNDVTYFRPTYPVTLITTILREMFYRVGMLCGIVATFIIDYLHLDKIFDTLYHILGTLTDLLWSFTYFAKGLEYIAYFYEYYLRVYVTGYVVCYMFCIVPIVLFVRFVMTYNIRTKISNWCLAHVMQ